MSKPERLVLFFPFNLLSHYLRCIQLADAIKDDCRVMFAGSPPYNSYVREAGFETFECENYDAVEMMRCAGNFDFSWINERSIERIFTGQVNCINSLKPSLVIGDGINTLRMAAEVTGVQYWSLMNGYMSKHYSLVRDVPAAHPAAKYSKQLPPKIYASIIKFAEGLAFRQVHKPFRKVRKKYKLSKLSILPDEMEGQLNLILDLPALFPQKSEVQRYINIGPVFHSGIAGNSALYSDRPKIFVSMGSSGSWKKAAFLNDPLYEKYNVIAAGDNERVLNAPHITHHAFVSDPSVWSNAALVICHGGNGTIYQSLSYGIPVICFPYLFEQEYNAKRIEQLGLGACLAGEEASDMKSVIEHWIARKNNEVFRSVAPEINVEVSKRKFREAFKEFAPL